MRNYTALHLAARFLPSSVRCAKPKATGTAQKGIPGFFVSVVKAQQTADDDDDGVHDDAAARLLSAEAASRSTSLMIRLEADRGSWL